MSALALQALGCVSPLPVLSLWQPWASLITAGFKLHETRHWPTKRRGRIAIHAAKRLERDIDPLLTRLSIMAANDQEDWWLHMPRGCVVAVADLVGCFSSTHLVEGCPPLLEPVTEADRLCGNYDEGRFGFRMENVRALDEPLPLIGRQTPFFEWRPPADLEARLLPPVDHLAASGRWEGMRHAE